MYNQDDNVSEACQKAYELLISSRYDTVSESERQWLQEHLHKCSQCQALSQELNYTYQQIALALPRLEPTAAWRKKLKSDLRQRISRQAKLLTPEQVAELTAAEPVITPVSTESANTELIIADESANNIENAVRVKRQGDSKRWNAGKFQGQIFRQIPEYWRYLVAAICIHLVLLTAMAVVYRQGTTLSTGERQLFTASGDKVQSSGITYITGVTGAFSNRQELSGFYETRKSAKQFSRQAVLTAERNLAIDISDLLSESINNLTVSALTAPLPHVQVKTDQQNNSATNIFAGIINLPSHYFGPRLTAAATQSEVGSVTPMLVMVFNNSLETAVNIEIWPLHTWQQLETAALSLA